MRIIRDPQACQRLTSRWRRASKTLGFVPTMGALHAGHLALLKRARRETDRVVASIFVNPLQFNQRQDYTHYPRTLEADVRLARAAGVDLLFVPSVHDLYPPDFQTSVEVTSVTRRWEGAARPGHFRGVTTIVAKLFHLVQPTLAYFGEKDAQQARTIQQMVRDLNWPLAVLVVPTVRESDGLAMSSRNLRLSTTERQAALVVFHALQAGRRLIESGVRRRETVLRRICERVRREPRARLEYAAIVDPETLEPVVQIRGSIRLLIAAWVGSVRLIDTILVNAKG